MKDWYSGVYKALILTSVIAFLISFFSSGTISLGAILAGYSVLILGILMILLILFNQIMKGTQDQSMLQILYSILLMAGPFLLMLGVIGFVLYLIIFYKNIIIDGYISDSYYTFSNITIILLLLQIYIVFTNINTDRFETTGKISKVTSSLIYLLGVLTIMSSLIIFTVLKYFRTDGFSTLN